MRKAGRSRLGLNRTSVRLSLQFAFLYAVLAALMFFGAYWMTNLEVRDWIEDQMASDAAALSRAFAAEGADALIQRIGPLSEFSFDNERIYELRGQDGAHVAGNFIGVDAVKGRDYVAVDAVRMADMPSREVSGFWLRVDRIGPYTLVQGTGDHVIAEVMEALSRALLLGYVIVIAAGLLIGTAVGVRTERRIRRIIDTLEDVAAGMLARRIADPGDDNDDLSRVSVSINRALDQLERLLESQKQIATDIAHDLRTPLQRLRQRLERMIADGADDTGLQAALGETETLIDTFKALPRIAQIESGSQNTHFVTLDLDRTERMARSIRIGNGCAQLARCRPVSPGAGTAHECPGQGEWMRRALDPAGTAR